MHVPARRHVHLSALALAVSAMVASLMVFAAPAQAAEIGPVDGITYDLADGATSVTALGYDDSQGLTLVVPDSVDIEGDTYPVTAIGDGAFSNGTFTTVSIGDNVTTIGDGAFSSGLLTTVAIGDNVTAIGDGAFLRNQLASLDLGTGVTSIGEGAFKSNLLTSLTIPDSVTFADIEAFADNDLTGVDIGSGLTSLAYAIFVDNEITSVTIPDTITELDGFTFYNNRLTSLDLGTGLTTLGEADFYGNLLAAVTLPASLTNIGDSTFFQNDLTAVTIPPSVTRVGIGAFSENELTTITIPDGVTEIGSLAFFRNALTTVSLGAGLTTIGDNAFIFNQISTVAIPASVATVGASAFAFNPLEAVTFLGAAPEITAAGDDGSFGEDVDDVLLDYPAQFGQPAVQDGFTMPTWQGYRTYVTGTQPPIDQPVDPPFDPNPPASGPGGSSPGLTATIVGVKREWRTLVASTNLPAGAAVTYQWRADGKAIRGATKRKLTLAKAQAARRITVSVTAGGQTVTAASSLVVGSKRPRLVVTPSRIGNGDSFQVIASGLQRGQKVRIILGGRTVFAGTADSRGIVDRTVRFPRSTSTGQRRIRVSGYSTSDQRTYTVTRTVRYLKD